MKIQFVIIVVCIVAIAIILSTQVFTKPVQTNNEPQYIPKENISTNSNSSELSENYTSTQLLSYCTDADYQVYNDVCVRGLWDISDQCNNKNFSNINSICNDPKFIEFEDKVNKVMQDLDKSLTQFVDSCTNAKSNNDTSSCTLNIGRIQNDCSDPRFYKMMSICKDARINQFNGTH